MNHKLHLGGYIEVVIVEEISKLRVLTTDNNVLFMHISLQELTGLLVKNFDTVKRHYTFKEQHTIPRNIDDADIDQLSLKVVLYYLYMYNMWRIQYTRPKYQDLSFKENDFEHPSTHDIIFSYLREKHPGSWQEKSACLLGLSLADLKVYYARREQYYNK